MSTNVKDTILYDELEVQPDVTPEELKKAYFKLARKYHPDRNPTGGERMTNITYAYQILSDPKKRKTYDQVGVDHFKDTKRSWLVEKFPSCVKKGWGLIWSVFPASETNQQSTSCTTAKNQNKKSEFFTLKVSIEDLYTGAVIDHPLITNVVCDYCKGEYKYANNCELCRGKGTIEKTKTLKVHVEKGLRDNDSIYIKGEGTNGGDVEISLLLKFNMEYTVSGDNITMITPIYVSDIEAQNGFKRPIKYLDGKYLDVGAEAGEISYNRKRKEFPNAGLPLKSDSSKRGKLIVEYNIHTL